MGLLRALAPLVVVLLASSALAEERFPAPEFRSGYQLPPTFAQEPARRATPLIDAVALLAALGIGAWLVIHRRSRRWVFILTIACVAYFGFYRRGCICPVGSIQNVALAAGASYALPWLVALFFALPLVFALFYGRVFCAGICPLGAMQDLVLWRPVTVPGWLEQGLGLFAWAYLGLAVLAAATNSDFLICQYDPFVGFFRFSGSTHMILIGASIMIISLFVGRVYCRFICPYGVLLRLLSPFSKRRVTITPDKCIDCRLCEQSCPFGAIHGPQPPEKPGERARSRRRMVWLMVLGPGIIALFALLGFAGGRILAGLHATVSVAERVAMEEKGLVKGTTEASAAFRGSGKAIGRLYEEAGGVLKKYTWGGAAWGGWMGLVVAGKLLAHAVRRRRVGYTADPGACVGCARCYLSCPVEQQRLGLIETLPVVDSRGVPLATV